jgi:hypothetical protein
MGIRHKKTIVDTLHTQFKEFELPLDIEYKSYAQIVGPRAALSPVAIKRSFKAWKYALAALRKNYPDIGKKKTPPPVVEVKAEEPTSLSGLEALAAKSKKKEFNDE